VNFGPLLPTVYCAGRPFIAQNARSLRRKAVHYLDGNLGLGQPSGYSSGWHRHKRNARCTRLTSIEGGDS